MARIIDSRSGLDQTIRIFDDFYSMDLVVNGNEFDIVYGYFKSVCSTKTIAQNFTAFLFKISQETNIPAVTLINDIQGVSKMEMNKTIAYYMNSFKSKTSLYGVSTVPSPNQAVARNIVQ
jgi:hypothetical protein